MELDLNEKRFSLAMVCAWLLMSESIQSGRVVTSVDELGQADDMIVARGWAEDEVSECLLDPHADGFTSLFSECG